MITSTSTTPLTDPALANAASALQAALNECAAEDVPYLEISLEVEDGWSWLADVLRDARDGLDCTPKLVQFAEQLHAALASGGTS
ncbi:hypothetical protein [Kineococcus radiotolerans]|uniref:Uncharacterized protein n=1 Tax=Kineococcus radiotolerans (strain ATCC BAA-149 / DSM 14245 / SRS30216) TaxID=266940 RepID=A6W8W0_KINRD|nr:hypothetical protein [Kineococcus radiotolerans]ABS03249.1 hypothetical protein Krad_1763 [Kineococcus radiotolerans SRS30216 = ATCC BAA-149]